MFSIISQLSRAQFSHLIRKTSSSEPLPLKDMTQYFLQSAESKPLSFWHDLPLNKNNNTVSCCIQIPREKTAKFQVIKSVPYHPIMQDTRKNLFTKQEELRFYAQFPLFNYGFIPQTWEQNIYKNQLGLYGDDDPLDICELSQSKERQIGQVMTAKVLGSFCLIDQGEVDWKVLMLQVNEANQKKINTYQDIDPRLIQSVMNWFKSIKVFDGKAPNTIAFDQKIFNQSQTLALIDQTHNQWKKLLTSQEKAYSQVRRKYHINN